jgi:hypothetical protein
MIPQIPIMIARDCSGFFRRCPGIWNSGDSFYYFSAGSIELRPLISYTVTVIPTEARLRGM